MIGGEERGGGGGGGRVSISVWFRNRHASSSVCCADLRWALPLCSGDVVMLDLDSCHLDYCTLISHETCNWTVMNLEANRMHARSTMSCIYLIAYSQVVLVVSPSKAMTWKKFSCDSKVRNLVNPQKQILWLQFKCRPEAGKASLITGSSGGRTGFAATAAALMEKWSKNAAVNEASGGSSFQLF